MQRPDMHVTRYMILAAIFGGLAMSVKWTGVTFLGIVGLLELWLLWRERTRARLISVALLTAIPLVLYYSIFLIHLSLLYKSGPGDAFMTPEFRTTKSTFGKVIELNVQMYKSNAGLTATHPYSSKWYSWPFMARGIYYWNSDAESKIYLIGNPFVWWISTFAIAYMLLWTLSEGKYGKKLPLLICAAYLVNMLPFIGISRAMFLYHYFSGLLIAIIALVYLVDQLKNRRNIAAGLLIVVVAGFVYFAPLSYGKPPLTREEFTSRMWLKGWE